MRRPVMGGWVILLMTGVFVSYFAWPTFAEYVKSQRDQPTPDKVEFTVENLESAGEYGSKLAAQALRQTQCEVSYDGAYYQIDYPMGDVPANKGMAADVVIRSYRSLGVDLQKLVHEDMKVDFRLYPQLWGLKGPDTNIDHRRVPNLQRFFSRHGQEIAPSRVATDYKYGDIVVWLLPHGEPHIGIAVPGPGSHSDEIWVVHNVGKGPQWENTLLDYEIVGHYRFDQ